MLKYYALSIKGISLPVAFAAHTKTGRNLWAKLQTRPGGLERCNFAAKEVCSLASAMGHARTKASLYLLQQGLNFNIKSYFMWKMSVLRNLNDFRRSSMKHPIKQRIWAVYSLALFEQLQGFVASLPNYLQIELCIVLLPATRTKWKFLQNGYVWLLNKI